MILSPTPIFIRFVKSFLYCLSIHRHNVIILPIILSSSLGLSHTKLTLVPKLLIHDHTSTFNASCWHSNSIRYLFIKKIFSLPSLFAGVTIQFHGPHFDLHRSLPIFFTVNFPNSPRLSQLAVQLLYHTQNGSLFLQYGSTISVHHSRAPPPCMIATSLGATGA